MTGWNGTWSATPNGSGRTTRGGKSVAGSIKRFGENPRRKNCANACGGARVDLYIRRNENGRIVGVTFIDHETRTVVNGSRLGKAYSANAFELRFGGKRNPGKTRGTCPRNKRLPDGTGNGSGIPHDGGKYNISIIIHLLNFTVMQQEDDLRGLAKTMDFMRALSILFVVINIYWFCYGQIREWGNQYRRGR